MTITEAAIERLKASMPSPHEGVVLSVKFDPDDLRTLLEAYEEARRLSKLNYDDATQLASRLEAAERVQAEQAATIAELVGVVRAHRDKWLKRAEKHARADGRRSDCQIRDIERAKICGDILADLARLSNNSQYRTAPTALGLSDVDASGTSGAALGDKSAHSIPECGQCGKSSPCGHVCAPCLAALANKTGEMG